MKWFTKKEECLFKEFTKDCFRKKERYFFSSPDPYRVTKWIEWELLKASGRYVKTDTAKKFECLVDKKVVWIDEHDLQWPKC